MGRMTHTVRALGPKLQPHAALLTPQLAAYVITVQPGEVATGWAVPTEALVPVLQRLGGFARILGLPAVPTFSGGDRDAAAVDQWLRAAGVDVVP